MSLCGRSTERGDNIPTRKMIHTGFIKGSTPLTWSPDYQGVWSQ